MSKQLSSTLINDFRQVQQKLELLCFEDMRMKMDIDEEWGLPDEIFDEIVGYLTQTDVLTICLLSKRFYRIGIRKLFKNIYVNSPDNIVIRGVNLPFYQSFTFIDYKPFLKLVKNNVPTSIQTITFHKPKFSTNFFNVLQEKLLNTRICIIDDINKIKPSLQNWKSYQIRNSYLLGFSPEKITELEIDNDLQDELIDVIPTLSIQFPNLVTLNLINFKYSLPKSNYKFDKIQTKNLLIYGKFDLKILDIFKCNRIAQLLLINKNFDYVNFNYQFFNNFSNLSQLFLGGNMPVYNIVSNLPRNHLIDLKLQLNKSITTTCLDEILGYHSQSLATLSYSVGDKFTNGIWKSGLVNGKYDPDAQTLIDDLNEIPDKYPKLVFASIFNNHFIIDRCFGDFIEAEQIVTPPMINSRRSSEVSQEEFWTK